MLPAPHGEPDLGAEGFGAFGGGDEVELVVGEVGDGGGERGAGVRGALEGVLEGEGDVVVGLEVVREGVEWGCGGEVEG